MTYYLDTSALVKLYISEAGSEQVDAVIAQAEITGTSLIAYPETLSAFSRKYREHLFDRKVYHQMRRAFEKDWRRVHVIGFTREISRSAGRLIHRHGLRGFDAIHLATALYLKAQLSIPVTFLCFDERLSKAAKTEGMGED